MFLRETKLFIGALFERYLLELDMKLTPKLNTARLFQLKPQQY